MMALNLWLRSMGRNEITGWRWRKRGWIKTVNISGRQYVTVEAAQEFRRRAEAGEFSKDHIAPINFPGQTAAA